MLGYELPSSFSGERERLDAPIEIYKRFTEYDYLSAMVKMNQSKYRPILTSEVWQRRLYAPDDVKNYWQIHLITTGDAVAYGVDGDAILMPNARPLTQIQDTKWGLGRKITEIEGKQEIPSFNGNSWPESDEDRLRLLAQTGFYQSEFRAESFSPRMLILVPHEFERLKTERGNLYLSPEQLNEANNSYLSNKGNNLGTSNDILEKIIFNLTLTMDEKGRIAYFDAIAKYYSGQLRLSFKRPKKYQKVKKDFIVPIQVDRNDGNRQVTLINTNMDLVDLQAYSITLGVRDDLIPVLHCLY